MTKEELTEIVKLADKKKVEAELNRRGYVDCEKHRKYKHIGLDVLFNGNLIETDEFPDAKNKRHYQGGIVTNVSGYEKLEFIIININDDKNIFPIEMLIQAKEL